MVDCANGAATTVGAAGCWSGSASRTTVVANAPDGTNINVGCGSTHLGRVSGAVRAARADLGLAFDGDADRVLAVDAHGNVVDGDHMLAIWRATALARGPSPATRSSSRHGEPRRPARLEALGVERLVTDVGDRYVLAAMRSSGAVLGGEQSGHVIALDRQTTGDGLMTAAMLLMALARADESLEEAARLVRSTRSAWSTCARTAAGCPTRRRSGRRWRGPGRARRGRPRGAARLGHRGAGAGDGGGRHGRAL